MNAIHYIPNLNRFLLILKDQSIFTAENAEDAEVRIDLLNSAFSAVKKYETPIRILTDIGFSDGFRKLLTTIKRWQIVCRQ
jgi:hypothetical protein